MIWKSSYAKRTQGLALKRKIKKAPALREGTKRGRKVAMPQADQNDRTRAICPSQIQLRLTWSQRYRWWRNGWTLWWTPLEDEFLATSMTWSIKTIRHSLHSLIRSPFHQSFACCRWKVTTDLRTPRSLGVSQDPKVPSRGGERDHVQSLPHHAEGIHKDLVQQVNT